MKKIRYNKGFTLVETLIVVGAIVLLSAMIFSTYLKKAQDFKIQKQLDYLTVIQNNVQRFAKSSTTFATVTEANLIAADAIPRDMINAGAIRNLYGGNMIFAPTTIVAAGDSVGITINAIPDDACTKIASSKFSESTNRLTINGTVVRANGAVWDSNVVVNASINCNNVNNNVILFEKIIERLNVVTGPTTDPVLNSGLFVLTNVRNTELPVNIPTGDFFSPIVTACAGGSMWNGRSCGCAAAQSWDGKTCVTMSTATAPGVCPLGQGWNLNRVCVPLPNGVSITPTYLYGRNIPNSLAATAAVFARPADTVASCTAVGAQFNGWSCQRCPDRPAGVLPFKAGVWDAATLRCAPF